MNIDMHVASSTGTIVDSCASYRGIDVDLYFVCENSGMISRLINFILKINIEKVPPSFE